MGTYFRVKTVLDGNNDGVGCGISPAGYPDKIDPAVWKSFPSEMTDYIHSHTPDPDLSIPARYRLFAPEDIRAMKRWGTRRMWLIAPNLEEAYCLINSDEGREFNNTYFHAILDYEELRDINLYHNYSDIVRGLVDCAKRCNFTPFRSTDFRNFTILEK